MKKLMLIFGVFFVSFLSILLFLNRDELTFSSLSKIEASTFTPATPEISEDISSEELFKGSGITEEIKSYSSYFNKRNRKNLKMAIIEVGTIKKPYKMSKDTTIMLKEEPALIYTDKAPGIVIPENMVEAVREKTNSSINYISLRWAKQSEINFCKSDRWDGRYEYVRMD